MKTNVGAFRETPLLSPPFASAQTPVCRPCWSLPTGYEPGRDMAVSFRAAVLPTVSSFHVELLAR